MLHISGQLLSQRSVKKLALQTLWDTDEHDCRIDTCVLSPKVALQQCVVNDSLLTQAKFP